MAVKGFFFSLDVLFAVTIALIILVAVSFNLLRGQEDPFSSLYLSKLANDALVVLDKNKTLSSLNETNIVNGLDAILQKNLAYRINIKVYECEDNKCSGFNEVVSKKISYTSPSNTIEENSVIAKRSFLTFENKRVKYFSNAELRVWLQ